MSQEESLEQMKHYLEQIEVKREDVTTITTPPFLPAFAAVLTEILTAHNIRVERKIDSCLVHFPAGTSKTELLPRTHDERYRIVLPDGFELEETRHRGALSSYLHCDAATLTPEQQRRLKSTS